MKFSLSSSRSLFHFVCVFSWLRENKVPEKFSEGSGKKNPEKNKHRRNCGKRTFDDFFFAASFRAFFPETFVPEIERRDSFKAAKALKKF